MEDGIGANRSTVPFYSAVVSCIDRRTKAWEGPLVVTAHLLDGVDLGHGLAEVAGHVAYDSDEEMGTNHGHEIKAAH